MKLPLVCGEILILEVQVTGAMIYPILTMISIWYTVGMKMEAPAVVPITQDILDTSFWKALEIHMISWIMMKMEW